LKHTKLTVTAGLLAGGALVVGPLTAASGSSTTSTGSQLIVSGPAVVVVPGANGVAQATCNGTGSTVAGGGFSASSIQLVVFESRPLGNIWRVRGHNNSAVNRTLQAFVVCR
jgi:hypothetical protein